MANSRVNFPLKIPIRCCQNARNTIMHIHRESKKGRHYTLVHIFAKY